VAHILGWHLLDSGALYRLTALAANRAGVAFSDVEGLARVAATLPVEFGTDGDGGERILLAGADVTAEVRTESTGELASQVAEVPAVREALLARQRAFARAPGLVADGRDMGTVVFPSAPLKVYLTASAEERARRRYKQLKQKDIDVSLAALSREIAARDERDAQRAVSPLRPAADARTLNSTDYDVDEVIARVLLWKNQVFGVGGAEA
jgi:cytidylate kinase